MERILRRVAVVVMVAGLCVATAACSWPFSAPEPAVTTAPTPVVPTSAPTDAGEYTCFGVPDVSLKDVFGPDARISASNFPADEAGKKTNCLVFVPSREPFVFYASFGFFSEEYNPWHNPSVSKGTEVSFFSFDGVDGRGGFQMGPRRNGRYGAAVFTCGDRYLVFSAGALDVMNGDPKGNMINMTQAALPWLCGDETVPGPGVTMAEARPDRSPPLPVVTPTPPRP